MSGTEESLEQKLQKQQEAIDALQNLLKNKTDKTEAKKADWSLGLSDDEESNHDGEKLIHDETSKDDDENLVEIEELLKDIEKGTDLGPEVATNVAESFMKTVLRPLSKESRSKLQENVKTPSNCPLFVPPKINNEIWKLIPSHARLLDVKQQQNQQAIGTALSALTKIADIIISRKSEIPKDIVSSIVKLAMDGGNILGDQTQQLNSARRLDLKKYLNPEYSGICTTQTAQSEWLFGNDLNESLKNSKSTSSLIRNTRGNRFQPYGRTPQFRQNFNSSSSLNFNRPFRHPQRGSGQYRQSNFRPNFNNATRLSPMWKSHQNYRPPRQ